MDERTAQRAQETYRENQIQMATREQLLLITYDIGIRYCLAAEKAIQARDVEQINANLQKAQAVIRELMVTLDMEKGGGVADSLMRLYDYMYYQLVDANVKKKIATIVAVRNMMEELKATWEEAIRNMKAEVAQNQKAAVAQAVPAGGGANFAY